MSSLHYDKANGDGRVRLLRLIEARHALTIADLVAATDRSRDYLASVLSGLERDGLIAYDPTTEFFRLSELGAQVRNPMKKITAPIDLSAERDRLILEFEGLIGLAEAAVADDDVLSERLQIALSDGFESPDLYDVPKYRRPQVIEEAIDAWLASTREGPCGWCGSRTTRRAPSSLSYLDSPEVPGFTTRADGTRACAWCANMLASRTVDEFRELIFNAVAGTIGIVVVGQFRSHHSIVPFAHETQTYSAQPWGHLTDVHRAACRLRAQQVVHRSRFVTSEGQIRIVGVPGITTPIWDINDIPNNKRSFKPLADIRQDRAEAKALAERRAAHEAAKTKQGFVRRAASQDAFAAEQARQEQELQDWAKREGIV